MEETSRGLLDVIRSDDKIAWIADQLIASFSEGLAHSAKELNNIQDTLLEEKNLSTREKTKREKYETSRPYDENEKIELVSFALREIFITIPSMQNKTAKSFQELGSRAQFIQFTAPDEEERPEGSYTQKFIERSILVKDLEQRLERFLKEIKGLSHDESGRPPRGL